MKNRIWILFIVSILIPCIGLHQASFINNLILFTDGVKNFTFPIWIIVFGISYLNIKNKISNEDLLSKRLADINNLLNKSFSKELVAHRNAIEKEINDSIISKSEAAKVQTVASIIAIGSAVVGIINYLLKLFYCLLT